MAGSVVEGDVRIREDAAEKPELTGEEIELGGHGPVKQVRKVPKYLGWLALFGPGAIYAATAQGSGELSAVMAFRGCTPTSS
jgi:hypothetical protein